MKGKDARAEIVRFDKARIWHPWTPMRQYIEELEPLVIERAQGSRLYDLDGRTYLDAISSWWVSTLGHGHPRLVNALKEQADQLCHSSLAGMTHGPAADLAELLCRSAPAGLERVFFTDNGSTAIEVALKIAQQYWKNVGQPQKTQFLALNHGFHGETLGAESLCGIPLFRRGGNLPVHCTMVPAPDDAADCERAIGELKRALDDRGHQTAALFLEPRVQGGAGMHIYPAEYVRAARSLCDRYETLLIADEIFSGYGRTGPMWACDSTGISPDLMCLGKGFSGGLLPMAATLVTEQIFTAFFGGFEQALLHGHSYCGNPLGAAVASETLRIYRDEGIVERAQPKAKRIEEAFKRISELPGTYRARSLGMIGAVDLVEKPSYLGKTGWRVAAEAQRRGVFLRPIGDVVYIAPPLNIPDEELDEILQILSDIISRARG